MNAVFRFLVFVLFLQVLISCADVNSKGTPDKGTEATRITPRMLPKDTLLQALQDAAAIVADSSATTIPRLQGLLASLSERFIIKVNASDEIIDTAAVYMYLDSAFYPGNTCVLQVTALPAQLRAGLSIEDFKKKFGASEIEKKEFQQLTLQQVYPFVFKGAVKTPHAISSVKVYPDRSMPKEGYRNFEINKIDLCYNQ
ncbi:hypothetical protein A8C56_16610 [Niabella ginsenosidivorans]|uniref:Lipoprotein n=2 Tax=Niabella ginsenosidivorans TaxID=1176587 RepID=A0A1A9I3X3_9BACT|nr:hypothetical protein A8C56_16610 [Niabella ginsenosidivorans]